MVYATFGDAVVELRSEFADKQAEPTLAEQLLLTAIGAVLPGAVGLTISHLQKSLTGFAMELIKTRPKLGEILTEDRVGEVVNAYVALDAADAEQGIRDYLTQGPTPPAGPTGEPMPIGELLDATIDAVHAREEARDSALAGMDRGQLTGVWAQFAARNTSISYFKAQIRDLVAKHEAIAKAAASGGGGVDFERIVMLDAHGEVNPAVIEIKLSGGIWRSYRTHFVFKEWVAPEMREAAVAAGERQEGGLQTIGPTRRSPRRTSRCRATSTTRATKAGASSSSTRPPGHGWPRSTSRAQAGGSSPGSARPRRPSRGRRAIPSRAGSCTWTCATSPTCRGSRGWAITRPLREHVPTGLSRSLQPCSGSSRPGSRDAVRVGEALVR